MAYQVLARKWRPKNFKEVVGQTQVVRTLTNALAQNRLHHAYLFTGTRGVGKTSLARIFAKALCCETGVTATPCGECEACREIDTGTFIDLLEVDAASRTKVEDTRELLENVQYSPAKGRYKIYLIDEVHMLSTHSFNALLKTLEEPPPHIKFLLATTDPQKIPITVVSRCLQFNLKAVEPNLIQQHLAQLLTKEQIPFEEEALRLIALHANGSIRDALSLLDQAIAFGNNQVFSTNTQLMLGVVDAKQVLNILDALAKQDLNSLLQLAQDFAASTTTFPALLDALLEAFHHLALQQLLPEHQSNLLYYNELKPFATRFTAEELQLYYQITLNAKRDLNLAPSPQLGFEMLMMRLIAFQPVAVATPNLDQLHTTVEKNSAAVTVTKATKSAVPPLHKPTTPVQLDLTKLPVTGATKALLAYCVITNCTNELIEIALDPSQSPLLTEQHKKRLCEAIKTYLNNPDLKVTIKLGTSQMATPVNIAKAEAEATNLRAVTSLNADQTLQSLLQKYDAKILPDSIKPIKSQEENNEL